MTPSFFAALLVGALLLAALGGPWLLRRAAPALARAPRLSVSAMILAAVVWLGALVAIGPIVAWMSSGPAWLPDRAAEVCARCLSAATPFSDTGISLAIPAVIPLALPVIGASAMAIGLVRSVRNLARSRSVIIDRVMRANSTSTLLGREVHVSPDTRPYAFALPRRSDGIVISRGAIATLSPGELEAVLVHERAHQQQCHHLLLAFLNGVTQYFRWVPFISAVRDAVPHYVEIAADYAARDTAGTTALASALLKLGTEGHFADGAHPRAASVLHAGASERVKSLVGVPMPAASKTLTTAAGAYAIMLAGTLLAVHWPYILAVATGC